MPSKKSVIWDDVILDAGWCQIPNLLLQNQHKLYLTNDQLCTVVHVLSYKFSSEDPYPNNKTIAKRMGCTERSVRRHIAALKEHGYLVRHKRTAWSYEWDFSGLLSALRAIKATDPPDRFVPSPPDKSVTQNKTKKKKTKKKNALRSFAKERQEPTTPLKSTASRSATGFMSIGDVIGDITSSIGEGNAPTR